VLTAVLAGGHLLASTAPCAISSMPTAPVRWRPSCGAEFSRQRGPLTLICLLLALWLAWRGRSGWPVLPVVVGFLLTGFAIKPLKVWSHRPPRTTSWSTRRPSSPPPIGLVRRRAGQRVVPLRSRREHPRLVRHLGAAARPLAESSVAAGAPDRAGRDRRIHDGVLGFHWLTDTIAGLLIGLVLSRLVQRIDWLALSRAAGPGTGTG